MKRVTVLMSIFTSVLSQAAITTTDSFRDLIALVDQLSPKSLVIFDVDKVIIERADPFERGIKRLHDRTHTIRALNNPHSSIVKQIGHARAIQLWSQYVQSVPRMIIDPHLLPALEKLRTHKIPYIALTQFLVGRDALLERMITWHINDLKRLGFYPSPPHNASHDMVFKQYSYQGTHPRYTRGFLCTHRAVEKGILLKEWLRAIDWRPDRIIMYDNKLSNLQSVKKICKRMKIPFTGVLYTGAQSLPWRVNRPAARAQLTHLVNKGEWLSVDQIITNGATR